MKKMVLLSGCLMFAITVFAEPTVSDVRARQRYPWNGMVDIDYTITGDASGCKLDVIVEDKQTGKRYVPTKFLSTKSVSAGRHRLTWSTEAEGVSIVSTNVSFTLALASKASETVTNNLYYVIDLSAGPTATSYPVSTLSGIPGGEWSDEYKTTKLVLRRIEPGTFSMGGGRYSDWHPVRITKAFYMGVFEVTQKQWELITGSNPSTVVRDAMCPVNDVSYNDIRGSSLGGGWPNTSEVDASSFLGLLRSKTSLTVDLPTEAQWEYACRAGTTSLYNNGGDTEADLAIVGRYCGNCNDGRGGFSPMTRVGFYAPNAWGLFDMHGNVAELCLDWFGGLPASDVIVENPVGASYGDERAWRGGSAWSWVGETSGTRYDDQPWSCDYRIGVRLSCNAAL